MSSLFFRVIFLCLFVRISLWEVKKNSSGGSKCIFSPHPVGSCNQQSISVEKFWIIQNHYEKFTLYYDFFFLLFHSQCQWEKSRLLPFYLTLRHFYVIFSDQLIPTLATKLPEHNSINRVVENLESPLFSK